MQEGRVKIKRRLPPIVHFWEQDADDPDLWHCRQKGLTKRTCESFPDELEGQDVMNYHILHCPLPIATSEDEIIE